MNANQYRLVKDSMLNAVARRGRQFHHALIKALKRRSFPNLLNRAHSL